MGIIRKYSKLSLGGGLLLAIILGLMVLTGPVRAAGPIMVTTTGDVIAVDGLCSLREAIIAANTDSAVSDCPAGSGADTILFSASLPQPALFVLTKTGANENGSQTGDLDLSGTLIISGTNLTDAGSVIIDGNGSDRVLEILSGAHITLAGLTIRNGKASDGGGVRLVGGLTLLNSRVEVNQGDGIRNEGGLLNLSKVEVISNTGGYGIRNQGLGSLMFNEGRVSGNQMGGIYNTAPTATMIEVELVNNSGHGGVYNSGASLTKLTLKQSLVATNTATSGGGIFNEGVGASASLYDVRITNNMATASGGGVFNNGVMSIANSTIDHNKALSGGGIEHFGGNLHLTNDTLNSNSASDNGGGLYNESNAILTNVTFNDNTAGDPANGGNIFNDNAQLSFENSLLANITSNGNCVNSGGSLNSLGHNLDSGNTCGFNAAGDIINSDPLLGPLQDNGGPTWTQALLPGSPAIEHGNNAACPATDQRGLPRPQGPVCDIGAFEFGDAADLVLAVDASFTAIEPNWLLTYTLTISNLGPSATTVVTLTDTLPHSMTHLSSLMGGSGTCTFDSGEVTCGQFGLNVGSSVTGTIVGVSPLNPELITNTASVSSPLPDLNPENNQVTTVVSGGNGPKNETYPVYLPLIFRDKKLSMTIVSQGQAGLQN